MDELSPQEQWELSQIKQRPSRLQAKPIGSVVRRLMTQTGYGQTQATNQLTEVWAKAAGETLRECTQPGNISRGTLHIWAANNAVIQELYFQKKQILDQIRAALPDAGVKDIKARVGRIG